MGADAGLHTPQGIDELGDGALAGLQLGQEPKPGGISEHAKEPGQRRGVGASGCLNHGCSKHLDNRI